MPRSATLTGCPGAVDDGPALDDSVERRGVGHGVILVEGVVSDDLSGLADHRANTWASSAKALNSSALPLGSHRNIVDCSPTWPTNRTCGSITKRTPAPRRDDRPGPARRRVRAAARSGGRDVVAVDDVGDLDARRAVDERLDEVGDDLVAEQVEVHPVRGRPPLGTPQHVAVERAGLVEVAHREGQMEAGARGAHGAPMPRRANCSDGASTSVRAVRRRSIISASAGSPDLFSASWGSTSRS